MVLPSMARGAPRTWGTPGRLALAPALLLRVAVMMLAVCPASLRGQGPAATGDTLRLSLEDARALALEHSPEIRAWRSRAQGAEGDLAGARSYPFNPTFELESLRAAKDGTAGSSEARLSLELEWAGQWGLRRGAAARALEVARADAADVERDVLAEVEAAYYSLQATERRLGIVAEVRSLNDRLSEAVFREVSEGNVSRMEANLATIEAGRSRAREQEAIQDRLRASVALGRILGLDAGVAVTLAEGAEGVGRPDSRAGGPGAEQGLGVAPADTLLAWALASRPDLQARRAALAEAHTRQRLAGREAIPNLELGAMSAWEGERDGRRTGLVVSMPLPLLQRNQGGRARASADTRVAEEELRAAEIRVAGEVREALAGFLAADRILAIYARDVLEPARENQTLLDAAFREGKIDLATLLLVRNQLLDAEEGYWEAWVGQRIAEVQLRRAVGLMDHTEGLE
ncbi:MAG: TolC family protein [Longimicrobiales bacterium]